MFRYNNDGWKDLMFVSGHVYPQADTHNWGTSFAERPLLFHNLEHGKKFEVMAAVEGTGLADVIPARGAAFGDLFNDGKIDVVINCLDRAPVLLRNVNDDHNHWVGLLLIGGPNSPREAVGSTVYLTAGGQRQRGDVMSGASFIERHAPALRPRLVSRMQSPPRIAESNASTHAGQQTPFTLSGICLPYSS